MGRVTESKEQQKKLQEHFGISSDIGREAMTIGMLADIADSLALLCDMYAMTNHIQLEEHKVDADEE